MTALAGCGGGSNESAPGLPASTASPTPTPSPASYVCPGQAPPSLAIGSFNLAHPPAAVHVDLREITQSSITFLPSVALTGMNYSYGFAVADYDCDAKRDISFFDSFTARVRDRPIEGANGYISWGDRPIQQIVATDNYPELPYRETVLFERQLALDVNGDNLPDIVGVVNSHAAVAAYINPGFKGVRWTRQYISTSTPGALNIAAADIDGDGDNDLVVTMRRQSTDPDPVARGIVWLENPGRSGGQWTQRAVEGSASILAPRSLVAADLNGDRKIDVVASDNETGALVLFEGDGGTTWKRRDFPVFAIHGHFGIALDLNRDDRAEILQPTFGGIKLLWLDPQTNDLKSQIIATFEQEDEQIVVTEVGAGDINADGRMDIVFSIGSLSTSRTDNRRGGTYWLDQTATSWNVHRFEMNTGSIVGLSVVDIDNDGDADVVTNTEYNVNAVTVWRNQLR